MCGELRLRREIVKILRSLNAQPVENIVKVGTPDVEFVGGWLEVKRTREWPAREATIVRLEHDLTDDQRRWIRRRVKAGGVAWVLIQIDRTYMLFHGRDACRFVGYANKKELIAQAYKVCVGLAELRRKLLEWVK